MIQEREYQQKAIDDITTYAANGHRRILLQAPTGSGKTIIASNIINHCKNKKKVLFLAHRREIIHQTSEKLRSLGIDHGIILADYPNDASRAVQLASIQSLYSQGIRRFSLDMPKADLVVVDECHHHFSSKTWQRVLDQYPDAFILGMTATPINRTGRGMGGLYDAIVKCPSITELTKNGYLVPARYFVPSLPDLSKIKVKAGDYVEKELEERMDNPKLIGDICENWSRIAPTRKTLVFGCGIRHSIHLAESFKAIGVKAAHIDGETDQKERDSIVEDFRTGNLQVLCNCAVFSEGFDAPEASALVFARPTKSILLYLQVAGRVLRPSPGKLNACIIDHGGVIHEHGLLTQDFDWRLDYGEHKTINQMYLKRRKQEAKKEITCGNCKQLYVGRLLCPGCGWKPMVRGKTVETYEAYLTEIDALDLPQGPDKKLWWQSLKGYAIHKKYKNGWAYYKYREKFKMSPATVWYNLPPIDPTLEVKSWILSRQIAWAKRRNPNDQGSMAQA